MDYFDYLSKINFSIINFRDLLIILIAGVVIMKVLDTIGSYIITEKEDRHNFEFSVFGGFFTYLFLSCLIVTFLDYNFNYHSKFRLSDFKPYGDEVLQINEKSLNQSVAIVEQEKVANPSDPDYFSWNDIQISDDIDQEVNKSEIIQSLGLTSDELTKLKKILSDPNPDPQSAVGHNCGQSTKKCRWCGKEMSANILITTQNNLNNLTSPYAFSMWGSLQIGYGIKPDINNYLHEVKTAIISGINSYDAIKYTCSANLEDFCSEKCKYEYSRN